MNKVVFPAILFLIFALPLQTQAKEMHHKEPKLMGVLFYADWCGSCKTLDPLIEKARGKTGLDDMDIVFVRMDLSDNTTRAQSAMLASSLGIGDIFARNDGKTGYMALIDTDTKEIVGKIDKSMKADEISSLIKQKL